MASKDVAEVDEMLKKHQDSEGKPKEHVADALLELGRHRHRLMVSVADQLLKGLGLQNAVDIDILLNRADKFGEELKAEREQLSNHRKTVVDSRKDKIQSLKSSDDFVEIEKEIAAAGESSEDLVSDYDSLRKHRDQLIETAKNELKKLQESDESKVSADVLNIWQSYA
eukprot:SAG31_NODE_12586_length_931_cov_1.018029_1_plen_168_part_10